MSGWQRGRPEAVLVVVVYQRAITTLQSSCQNCQLYSANARNVFSWRPSAVRSPDLSS